jgi:arylformamidase
MLRARVRGWDDAYANAAHIPGGGDYPRRWAEKAAAFRALVRPAVLPYGEGERERIDLFRPDGTAEGLVVFVHGGYWRAFDRGDWSHLAAGPLARGWAVAMPGYRLAPEARIAEIGRAVGRAVAEAGSAVKGPIQLAGHSAGGHLATRQVAAGSGLPRAVAERVERVVSISGLHDLRPLLRTGMNADLRLDPEEAQAESPALLEPAEGARVHAWVGGGERPEFVRQAELLANVWAGLGAETALTVEAGRHHFDVVEGLEAAGHPLTEAVCGDR